MTSLSLVFFLLLPGVAFFTMPLWRTAIEWRRHRKLAAHRWPPVQLAIDPVAVGSYREAAGRVMTEAGVPREVLGAALGAWAVGWGYMPAAIAALGVFAEWGRRARVVGLEGTQQATSGAWVMVFLVLFGIVGMVLSVLLVRTAKPVLLGDQDIVEDARRMAKMVQGYVVSGVVACGVGAAVVGVRPAVWEVGWVALFPVVAWMEAVWLKRAAGVIESRPSQLVSRLPG